MDAVLSKESFILLAIALLIAVTFSMLPLNQTPVPNFSTSGSSASAVEIQASIYSTSYFAVSGHIHSAKKIGATYAYWEASDSGCWSGFHGSTGWSYAHLNIPCPDGPEDKAGIGRLLKKLWEHYNVKDGGWAAFVKNGEKATNFVKEFGALAAEYGVTLVP